MNNKDIYKALGNIDDDMILEADPNAVRPKSQRGRVWRRVAIIAACLTIALGVSVAALLLPLGLANSGEDEVIDRNNLPSELREYADSEYIDVMLAIYKYNKALRVDATKHPSYTIDGIFDYLFGAFGNSGFDEEAPGAEAPEAMAPGSTPTGDGVNKGEYVETTDNQVSGVIEGDLFKRSDKYVFYLNAVEQHVLAYSIAGEESELVGIYKLPFFDTSDEGHGYVTGIQMYLSSDCSTLTVYGNRYGTFIDCTDGIEGDKYELNDLTVLSVDVSDPANMTLKKRVSVKGNCLSSRLVGGKLLMMTNFNFGYGIDYSDESTFLPQIDRGEGFESIAAEDIIFPEDLSGNMYTVVLQMDEKSLEIEGAAAFLSYSNTVYVSSDKIFITRGYRGNSECEKDGERYLENKSMTDIYALGYGKDGFSKLGGITVDGTLKDQYSLDEYEGILRVVTTTSSRLYPNAIVKNGAIEYSGSKVSLAATGTNAALYCIDIATWEIVGEVRDFAPEGETVESVRFDGDHAYVCTAVVITFTDPVYFFDLSDMSNITYTDTGVIDGYSSSLINFGDGLLLGIGFGENRDILKIEIYAENAGKVESVCSYERKAVGFSLDYKSYFIDRENGLVGLAINDYYRGSNEYVLLGFNGYELTELLSAKEAVGLDWLDPNYTRATLIEDYFYIFCNSDFSVIKMD